MMIHQAAIDEAETTLPAAAHAGWDYQQLVEDYNARGADMPTSETDSNSTEANARVRAVALKLGTPLRFVQEALDGLGLVLVYAEDLDEIGRMANLCVWDRTGRICSFCRCPRRRA